MQRRELMTLIGGVAIAWPTVIWAQQPEMPVIGFLSGASADSFAHLVAAFHEGLKETGFVEGENVAIEYRWADGRYDRLPAFAADLVNRRVAVIVASGGDRPTLAAKAATSTIPIVFTGSDNAVKFGLVDSLSRPGGNATGVSGFTSEVEAKKLDLLHELLPKARLIGVLVNPNNPTAETDVQDIQVAANDMGIQMYVVRALSEEEIDLAFVDLGRQKLEGLLVAHDPFFNSQRHQIVALATRLGVPAIYEHREFVLVGGLMSYGNSIAEFYRLAGIYAGRILKGAKPADLPVQQPTIFELVINLKTATALGLEFPSSILVRANDVVE